MRKVIAVALAATVIGASISAVANAAAPRAGYRVSSICQMSQL